MTQFQRVIKTAATVLAIVLAVSIIGGIVQAVLGLSFVVDVFNGAVAKDNILAEAVVTDFDVGQITALDIDLAASTLRIEIGTVLQISNNQKDVSVRQQGNTLVVEEEKKPFTNDDGVVVLTVPEDMVFVTAQIEMGAGRLEAESLNTAVLDLSIGAGEAAVDTLTVTDKAEIETGAGRLLIQQGTFARLDMELGVGKADITAALGNGSRVECGVGSLKLGLLNGKTAYTVRADTGIGTFTVDGQTVSDNTTVGNGADVVTIEGGVGSVDVTFV
ncbi:MAG: DUF4097 domain-containing protein [Ruminococcaceae bacterium]|nr:DUF4097 domain-containing protein [Oscillospiraceae bacterium]